jgi:SAM-dependent methyltransferase
VSRVSDRELGIRAAGAVDLDRLTIVGDNRAHGHRYEPTPHGVLDDLLLELGLEHRRYVFVDLGSGKGRVLCDAARRPWKRVLGVEFSLELHRAAEANIAALGARVRACRDVRSLHADAAEFAFSPEPTVVYLFNPFEPSVLARVVERLELSYFAAPCHKLVLYYMPVHEAVLERSPALARRATAADWVIYEAGSG